MNGIQIKVVIDTNVIFMALYDETSKAAQVIQAANQKKLSLFAPISVKEELKIVLKREMKLTEEEIEIIMEGLPVSWIEREIYEPAMEKTNVKHKPDKAVEALALILNCGILTADRHFEHIKNKLDINDLLTKLKNVRN